MLAILLTAALSLTAADADAASYLGAWDVEIVDPGSTFNACWWKVEKVEGKLGGSILWKWGSPEPIKSAEVTADGITITKGDGQVCKAKLKGEKLEGTVTYPDKKSLPIVGWKAPEMNRLARRWGNEVALFDGKSLAGWKLRGKDKKPGWEAKDGQLVCSNPGSDNDLMTDKTFQDFKLHIEFQVPKGSNSGIYLRGRYETQVAGDFDTTKPDVHSTGAIYGRIAPAVNALKKPDTEWQVADIELVGRTVTVVLNGKTLFEKKVIEGPTGGAIDSKEEEPGPLFLQGDHGKVAYRNILITPVRK